MSGVPFRGVSSNADSRFSDKEKKLLKSMKFPKEYEAKVDFAKLNFEAMKPWVAKRVTELLGIEDEVLVGYIYEQIEGKQSVDPRILQINLTGFLEKNTSLFVKELWLLMASAKDTQSGIPQKLLDDKEAEVKRRKELEESINKRMAAEREKREAERRENARKEAKEREERQRQREKERQIEYEKEVKRRDKEREERDRRRKEMYEKERERDLERRKKWEARAAEERQRDKKGERDVPRDRERDRDRDRRDRPRDRDSDRRAERDNGIGERHRYPLTERQKRELERQDEPMKDVEEDGKANAGPDSPGSEPEAKRVRLENGADEKEMDTEPVKKSKKEKKEKKEKKAKKEKKEKKDKSKHRKQSSSRSESPRSDDAVLEGQRSLEDDLRRKALLSVKKD